MLVCVAPKKRGRGRPKKTSPTPRPMCHLTSPSKKQVSRHQPAEQATPLSPKADWHSPKAFPTSGIPDIGQLFLTAPLDRSGLDMEETDKPDQNSGQLLVDIQETTHLPPSTPPSPPATGSPASSTHVHHFGGQDSRPCQENSCLKGVEELCGPNAKGDMGFLPSVPETWATDPPESLISLDQVQQSVTDQPHLTTNDQHNAPPQEILDQTSYQPAGSPPSGEFQSDLQEKLLSLLHHQSTYLEKAKVIILLAPLDPPRRPPKSSLRSHHKKPSSALKPQKTPKEKKGLGSKGKSPVVQPEGGNQETVEEQQEVDVQKPPSPSQSKEEQKERPGVDRYQAITKGLQAAIAIFGKYYTRNSDGTVTRSRPGQIKVSQIRFRSAGHG